VFTIFDLCIENNIVEYKYYLIVFETHAVFKTSVVCCISVKLLMCVLVSVGNADWFDAMLPSPKMMKKIKNAFCLP
jgi:hypothetical protein